MIKPLTSFRFFAALAVFVSHLSFLGNFNETKWIFENIFYEGYLGVTFFFILSGFILTYNYHEKFNEINIAKIKGFLKARIARIYPVYLLTFVIAIPLSLGMIFKEPLIYFSVAIVNLLMLQSFIPVSGVYFSYNGPSWSISDEMFFYILFPLLIYFLLKKIKINKKLWLVLIVCFVYVSGLILVWFMKDNDLAHWLFYVLPAFRILDFVIGIIIGLWFIRIKQTGFVSNSIRLMTFMELIVLILLILAFYFHENVHQTLRYWGYYQPIMIFIVSIFAFQQGYISKLLSNNGLIYLGEISFSFYMIHQLVIRYAAHVPIINGNPIVFLLFTLTVSLIASHLIYKYYEIPMKVRINKIKAPPKQKSVNYAKI
ncbi:acyltransferase family protein [Psychrobacillus sp. L3]|uniref:acyltransferase family protein n=1 Tax=Psychrobacillus sp. L3 TaxID=3236891 RepID=UPI0036F1ED84